MGVDINSFELEVSKIGDGELLVNQITSNIPSAVQISPTSVDSEGSGTYTVVIDISSIPDGLYTTRITIPFSNDNASSMEISFQVGSDRENIPIPEIYVALINDDTGEGVRFGRFDMPEGFVSFVASGGHQRIQNPQAYQIYQNEHPHQYHH
jgi:hypothetical protein